jgi:hypothetical protein
MTNLTRRRNTIPCVLRCHPLTDLPCPQSSPLDGGLTIVISLHRSKAANTRPPSRTSSLRVLPPTRLPRPTKTMSKQMASPLLTRKPRSLRTFPFPLTPSCCWSRKREINRISQRAGFAAAFIDREVESKGLDFLDREKAKRHAKQQVEAQIDSQGY